MSRKNVKNIKFLLITLFFYVIRANSSAVYALTPGDLSIVDLGKVNYSNPGSVHGGCSSEQYNGYTVQGCYNPNDSAGFRITLVDQYGKKVAGTKSIDFTGDESVYNNFKDKGYKPIHYEPNSDNSYYSYKYSSLHNDYNYITSDEDFELVLINKGPIESNISVFIKNLEKYYDSGYWKYVLKDEATGLVLDEKLSFFDFYLHYNGFLKSKILTKLNNNPSKYSEIANNNYYLLIEPTYFFWYSTPTYQIASENRRYGTVSEFAEEIYSTKEKDGLGKGLSRVIAEEKSCLLSTQYNEKSGFIPITKKIKTNGENCINVCSGHSGCDTGEPWWKLNVEKVADSGYGYGVSVISVSGLIEDTPGESSTIPDIPDNQLEIIPYSYASFDIDLCESNDGIISFEPSNGPKAITTEILKNNKAFEITDTDDVNQRVSCYDDVSYDFRDVLESLRKTRKTMTTLDLPTAKATISRTCWIGNSANEALATNFDSYSNETIKLNLYGNEYEFMPIVDTFETMGSNEASGGKAVNYLIYFNYSIDDPIIINSSSSSFDINGSIELPNIRDLFGVDKKLISDSTGTITINMTDGSESDGGYKCNFETTVEPSDTNIQFRTISLENPFPARNGSLRLPGMNWLNENNYVFDYITNNRGIRVEKQSEVSPEAMYDGVEPMYTVTLDSSTMLKIREYNKTNSYDSINLACDDDNMQCYSKFLRSSGYFSSSNLSGDCVLTYNQDDESIRNSFNKVIGTSFSDELSAAANINANIAGGLYETQYDFDKNYIIDDDDLDIFYNRDKNTQFYTCANKSYKSGGPTEGGND